MGALMKKALVYAWLELRATLQSPAALAMMLAAPIFLTLLVAVAFGKPVASLSTEKGQFVVAWVNLDVGKTGQQFLETVQNKELASAAEFIPISTVEEAQSMLADAKVNAVIIIPAEFSDSVEPVPLNKGRPIPASERTRSQIQIIAAGLSATQTGLLETGVTLALSRYVTGAAAGQVAVEELVKWNILTVQEAALQGTVIGREVGLKSSQISLVNVQTRPARISNALSFDWLGYGAISLLVLYIMLLMTYRGRAILVENETGRIGRLRLCGGVLPVFAGKLLSSLAIGAIQAFALIILDKILFNLEWGNAIEVVLFTLFFLLAASGWGMLLGSVLRTPAQAGWAALVINLGFALLAGNFVPRMIFPPWLQAMGWVTPNAWALDFYFISIYGGSNNVTWIGIGVLLAMGLILNGLAYFMFRKQYA
jgi:ABC-2 type transport system permease protein